MSMHIVPQYTYVDGDDAFVTLSNLATDDKVESREECSKSFLCAFIGKRDGIVFTFL